MHKKPTSLISPDEAVALTALQSPSAVKLPGELSSPKSGEEEAPHMYTTKTFYHRWEKTLYLHFHHVFQKDPIINHGIGNNHYTKQDSVV